MDNFLHLSVIACLIIVQIVTLVCASLALGGGSWIQNVRKEGEYFIRLEATFSYSNLEAQGGDLESIGMWRVFYFSNQGRSTPLPIRDPELKMGTVLYLTALFLGCVSVVLPSYQAMGVRPTCLVLSSTTLWSCIFQCGLLLTSAVVVGEYFGSTFEFDSRGYSFSLAWVSTGFSLVAVSVASFQLYLTYQNEDAGVEDDYNMSSPRQEERIRSLSSRSDRSDAAPLTSFAPAAPKRHYITPHT